jgi:hypothetical protein
MSRFTSKNVSQEKASKSPIRRVVPSDLLKPTPLVPTRQISFSTEQPTKTESKTSQYDNIDELIGLTDDYYDDNLFAMVDDIEKKPS